MKVEMSPQVFAKFVAMMKKEADAVNSFGGNEDYRDGWSIVEDDTPEFNQDQEDYYNSTTSGIPAF